jgi:hypothetical protein
LERPEAGSFMHHARNNGGLLQRDFITCFRDTFAYKQRIKRASNEGTRNVYTLLVGKPEDTHHLGVHCIVLHITDTPEPRRLRKKNSNHEKKCHVEEFTTI